MFPENTVIVLGAGASAEFGLPTGSSLFQRLLKEIPYKDKSSFSNSNNLSDYYLPSALMTTFNSYGNDMFNNEKLVEKARSTFESSIDLFCIFVINLMLLFFIAFANTGKETVLTAIPAIARLIW